MPLKKRLPKKSRMQKQKPVQPRTLRTNWLRYLFYGGLGAAAVATIGSLAFESRRVDDMHRLTGNIAFTHHAAKEIFVNPEYGRHFVSKATRAKGEKKLRRLSLESKGQEAWIFDPVKNLWWEIGQPVKGGHFICAGELELLIKDAPLSPKKLTIYFLSSPALKKNSFKQTNEFLVKQVKESSQSITNLEERNSLEEAARLYEEFPEEIAEFQHFFSSCIPSGIPGMQTLLKNFGIRSFAEVGPYGIARYEFSKNFSEADAREFSRRYREVLYGTFPDDLGPAGPHDLPKITKFVQSINSSLGGRLKITFSPHKNKWQEKV